VWRSRLSDGSNSARLMVVLAHSKLTLSGAYSAWYHWSRCMKRHFPKSDKRWIDALDGFGDPIIPYSGRPRLNMVDGLAPMILHTLFGVITCRRSARIMSRISIGRTLSLRAGAREEEDPRPGPLGHMGDYKSTRHRVDDHLRIRKELCYISFFCLSKGYIDTA
jgi:hypothetical protein